MSPFSIKNLLIINLFVLGLGGFPLKAWSAQYEYQVDFDARYGVHTYGASNVATNRQTLEFEQKAEFNKMWSMVL